MLTNHLSDEEQQHATILALLAELDDSAGDTAPAQESEPGPHVITAADVVDRASEQVALLQELIAGEETTLYDAADARNGLVREYDTQALAIVTMQGRLQGIDTEMSTVQALVVLTEGDAQAVVRLDALKAEQQQLLADLAALERTAPEREAHARAEAFRLDGVIADCQATIAAHQDRVEAIERAREEAHAQAGEEAAEALISEIKARRASVQRLQQQLEREEEALHEVRTQGIESTLASWPDLARKVARRYGSAIGNPDEAEVLQRAIAYFEALSERGKRVPQYSQTAHTSLSHKLAIDEPLVRLALANESGASPGLNLSNKIAELRTVLRTITAGDSEDSDE